MRVGVGRIVLEFHGNEKASIKSRELESLCKGLRREFNISALEIDEFDEPERCVMGFAVVIPDTWKYESAKHFVETICRKIDDTAFARVIVEDWDLMEVLDE